MVVGEMSPAAKGLVGVVVCGFSGRATHLQLHDNGAAEIGSRV